MVIGFDVRNFVLLIELLHRLAPLLRFVLCMEQSIDAILLMNGGLDVRMKLGVKGLNMHVETCASLALTSVYIK